MDKVFLGGTCNDSRWREEIKPLLTVDYFDPIVPVGAWNDECRLEELKQREECEVVLYVITPRMTGTYSIAEVVDDSNKRPERVVFVRLRRDGIDRFDDIQWKSLDAVSALIESNGGRVFDSLEDAAKAING